VSLVDQGYRSALVTGASSGLGLAFADALIDEGLTVWGTSRSPDRLHDRDRFVPALLDLADARTIDKLWERVLVEGQGVDIVVGNAGYGLFGEFADSDFEIWTNQIETMLIGTLRLVHLAMPHLKAHVPSAVVLVSSLACEFPLPYMSGYNAVKGGLSGFARGLMIESAGTQPYIVDFRPGDFRTSFNRNMGIRESYPTHPTQINRVGERLESIMSAAPDPVRAARALVRALRRKRHAVVRTGSLFQAKLAPLFSRLVPENWLRAVSRRYFGIH
jgi:short-subunit dehydrogenase